MKSSPVQRILAFLVESGGVFMVLQITLIILNTFPSITLTPVEVFSRGMNAAGVMLTAMYPALVLILVDRESARADEQGMVFEPSIMTQLAFAEMGSADNTGPVDDVPVDIAHLEKGTPAVGHAHPLHPAKPNPSHSFLGESSHS